jgi:RND family efflux transporter MFP subunit
MRVIEKKVNVSRRVIGTVDPLKSSTIGSAVDGRVVKFLINDGDQVKKDEPLAQLRTETLKIELFAARAELNLYEQRLAELENGSRPEDIDEARARMLGAKAAMENAAGKLQRMEALSVSRAASKTDLDDARERAEFNRHAYLATEALLKRIEEGPRIEQIAQAKARVELQKQRVRLIDDRITKHTIRAPFDGFVAAEFTEVGAWITSGDPVATIVQLDEVEIRVSATAEDAVQLRRGDTIRVEFPELPGQLFIGNVDRVVPVAESRARTFPIYIRMTNQICDGVPRLMAGMLARVELPTGQRQMLPLVTKDALVLDQDGCSVFVVDLDSPAEGKPSGARTGTVRQVPVNLGVAVGGLIQIRSTVPPGDTVRADDLVVVEGNERLRSDEWDERPKRVEIVRILEIDELALEAELHSGSTN